jgi:guanylate kinase
MKAASTQFLLLISGPSGVGKSSVYTPVMQADPKLSFSVSCTTRPPREGEIDGKHYHFLDRSDFERQQAQGAFVESFTVHDELYGTRRADLEKMLDAGLIPVLDVDVQGGEKILAAYQERVVSVFLFPPSFEELEERLRRRGTEDEKSLKVRLENARWEVDYARHYEYWLVNDELETAIEDLKAILRAERRRRKHWPNLPLSGPSSAA